MDINALPEMQKILKFIQNMEFRTTMFGGFKKTDVEENFAEAIRMYEDMTNSVVARYDQRIAELEASLSEVSTAEVSTEEMDRRISELTSTYEQQIAQITEEYEEKNDRLKRSSEAIGRAGQEMYAKVSEDAKKRMQEAEETARRTVAAAQARADALLVEARQRAEEALEEHRLELEADMEKARDSLTDLRKENEDIKAVLAEVTASYTKMLQAANSREAEMTRRLDQLYASMDRALDVASSLGGSDMMPQAELGEPIAAQVPDASIWNNWLNDVLNSVSEEEDGQEDATTAGHRRFALSIEDAFADEDLLDDELNFKDDAFKVVEFKGGEAKADDKEAKRSVKGSAASEGADDDGREGYQAVAQAN